jgi:hypothetical protein
MEAKFGLLHYTEF